jgi:hypothetical protein
MIGFAYASTWIGAAERAAPRRPASGLFHGLAGLVIGLPLLLEASTRFGVLSARAAATLLVALAAITLVVSWHRRLHGLAALAAIAGSTATILLSVTTSQVLPFATAAILIGVGAELVASHRAWRWITWPPALAAGVLVFGMVLRARIPSPLEPRVPAFAVALAFAATYVLIVTMQAIRGRHGASVHTIGQSIPALAIGLGGAFSLSPLIDARVTAHLGIAVLILGGAGYALMMVLESKLPDRAAAVLTTLAMILLLAGAVVSMGGPLRDIWLAGLAVALVWMGRRGDRAWLTIQGAAVIVAAAVTSGLIAFSAAAWLGSAAGAALPLTALLIIAVAASGAMSAGPIIDHRELSVVPLVSLLCVALAVTGAGAALVVGLGAIDARVPTPGVVAAERSIVIAALAIGLAWLHRLRRHAGFNWLVYAALAAGAVKIVVEDLRVSSPIAIFAALGAYGLALIVSARLLGRDDVRQ